MSTIKHLVFIYSNCLIKFNIISIITLASTVFKKNSFFFSSYFSHFNDLRIKFDFAIKLAEVNPETSFEQTW